MTAPPARIRIGHPVLRLLASFPVACFSGALVTDIAYAASANMMWADFSAWLLAGGMLMGVLAAIAGLAALATRSRAPVARNRLALVLGSIVTLALALLNNFVHSRDAWTSVVPGGLILSATTVIVMLATAWLGSVAVVRPVVVEPAGVRP